MTVQKLWDEYQHLTGSLTEHSRKLGFAGIASCWLFKTSDYTFPFLIYCALLLFTGFFLSDISHYFFGAIIIRYYTECQEKQLHDQGKPLDTPIKKANWVDWPAFGFFIVKNIFLLTGFIFVALELLLCCLKGICKK